MLRRAAPLPARPEMQARIEERQNQEGVRSCQEMTELVRPGKGPAPAAGAVRAAVDSERGHRLEPANGKAEGKAGRDAARAAVRGVAKRAAIRQELQI